jgi:hypothetical protein
MGLNYKIGADSPAPPVPVITFTIYLPSTEESDPNTVVITWATGGQSTGIIQYGTSPTALTTTVTDNTWTRYHSKTITGLLTDQEYYFKITATFFGDYTASTTVDSFYLSPLIAPLTIEAETVGHFVRGVGTFSSATIECITNRLTTVVVNYGTSSGSLTSTLTDAVFSRYHEIAIGSLILEQTIYYRITVTDSNGDTATTSIGNFTINGVMTQGYPSMPTLTAGFSGDYLSSMPSMPTTIVTISAV